MKEYYIRLFLKMQRAALFFLTWIYVSLVTLHWKFSCVAKDLEFSQYHFAKKSRWGKAVKRKEHECRDETCAKKYQQNELEGEICLRKCISSKCYKELYEWNELEEGERDIRWSSYKGCAADELRKKEFEETEDEENSLQP